MKRREFTIVGYEGGNLTSAYTREPINYFLNWLELATNGGLIFHAYAARGHAAFRRAIGAIRARRDRCDGRRQSARTYRRTA